MQMRSRADAGITAEGNPLSLFYRISHRHQHLAQMPVSGLSSVLMINIDHIAITAYTGVPVGVAQSMPLW